MLVLFATKGLELVAYLESSNHVTTERVTLKEYILMVEVIHTMQFVYKKCVLFKVTMNSLHTTLTHFEVYTTFEILRYSN